MNELMSGWINTLMNQYMSEWRNEEIDECMKWSIQVWIKEHMNQLMMVEWMKEWMNTLMNQYMNESMKKWTNACMNSPMKRENQWMSARMI